MVVVDTSILVYAGDQDFQFYAACRKWIEDQQRRPDAWFTTWPILLPSINQLNLFE